MGIDFGAILGGILGGVGNFGQQAGGAIEAQRQEALARDKLAQEQQYRDAMLTLERDRGTRADAAALESTRQFNATQAATEAGRFTDLPAAALPSSYAGGQPDANGNVRVQTNILPALNKMREDEVTQNRYGALKDYLLSRKGSPATPDAAMSPEGSMYSEQEVLPGSPAVAARPVDPNDLVGLLAGMPGGAELAKLIAPGATQKFGIHGGNAAGSPTVIYNQQTGEPSQIIPGVDPALRAPDTVTTQEGVFREVRDARGNVVSRERVGSPVQQPREPQQPNAAQLYISTMREYQKARETYGDDDPRTKNLAAIATGLRPQVDPTTGAPPPKAADPFKQAIADMITNKGVPGPAVKNPLAPAPQNPGATPLGPRPAAAAQGGTRVRDPRTGRTGTVPPGQPIPAGVEVIGR